ncbi:MAG TPA: hypothetical protein VHO06_20005 [Polyangia bacterium]|nr:hypothetical protein [Polyangia bacterium]
MGTPASGLLLLALLGGAGCIMETERGVPLYDLPARPGLDQVAPLGGYVAAVDGRDVSELGGAFELLPGCHVVTTPTHWGNGGRYDPVTANVSALELPIAMVAGRHYLVVSSNTHGAPVGRATLDVSETDAHGRQVEFSLETFRKVCLHGMSLPPTAP